jgi:uncharacterized protein YjbJ (UPF0337 family)
LTDRSRRERTIGGLAGKFVGKAKAALASATGNPDLAREGRLQEAQADTELDARRASAQAAEREAGADGTQRQATVDAAAASKGADAQAQVLAERTGAQRSVEAAEQVRVAATEEANRLEREAREAERVKQERKLD